MSSADEAREGEPRGGPDELRSRLEALGGELGRREAAHAEALAQARRRADVLRAAVASALDAFHEAATRSGAGHVRIELGPLRVDDKHVRAVEFDLERGRHRAVVTVKSRGEITLVGPFQAGKFEGPCMTYPAEDEDEVRQALGGFLERFIEEASTP